MIGGWLVYFYDGYHATTGRPLPTTPAAPSAKLTQTIFHSEKEGGKEGALHVAFENEWRRLYNRLPTHIYTRIY